MNMLKDGRLLKRVVVILAFCLLVGNVGSFETNAFASNPGELPDQIEVNGMLLQKVDTSDANYEEPKPLNDFVRPEE